VLSTFWTTGATWASKQLVAFLSVELRIASGLEGWPLWAKAARTLGFVEYSCFVCGTADLRRFGHTKDKHPEIGISVYWIALCLELWQLLFVVLRTVKMIPFVGGYDFKISFRLAIKDSPNTHYCWKAYRQIPQVSSTNWTSDIRRTEYGTQMFIEVKSYCIQFIVAWVTYIHI